MVNMKMEGKKIFQNTDQMVKVKSDGGASVTLKPTSVYRRINPHMLDDNAAPQLEKCDKDWTNLVAYGGSIIKQIGIKPVACKWGKKNFVTNFQIVYGEDHPVLFGLGTLRYLGLFVEHTLVFTASILWVKIFSHTPYSVTKFAGKTFSSDLRKLTAVSENLPKSKIIYSVIEKII